MDATIFTESNFKGNEKNIVKITRYIPKVINKGKPEHFFVIEKQKDVTKHLLLNMSEIK